VQLNTPIIASGDPTGEAIVKAGQRAAAVERGQALGLDNRDTVTTPNAQAGQQRVLREF
jgi:hypothetical protein